jgi:hypothetical protein
MRDRTFLKPGRGEPSVGLGQPLRNGNLLHTFAFLSRATLLGAENPAVAPGTAPSDVMLDGTVPWPRG